MKINRKKNINPFDKESRVCYIVAAIIAILCLLPVWIAFCASITTEETLIREGYPIWIPQDANLDAYKYLLLTQAKGIIRALRISVLSTVVGTAIALVVQICYAYAAAQKEQDFPFAGTISMLAWFTTVFSGGILPWYILCTRYYGLRNNIWALTLPACFSTFYMFLLRNGFKAVPGELIESAKIDGASHPRIMLSIVLPLSKVSIVTVGMFTVLGFWNDFHLSLYLGTQREYFTLQKLLYNMLTNITEMFNMDIPPSVQVAISPNTARMALTLLTLLPVIIVYPFAQKYLVQGVTVGAVKG